jgi:hypothetical protein
MLRRLLTIALSGQGYTIALAFPKLIAAANLVYKLSVERTFMKLQHTGEWIMGELLI